MSVPQFGVDVVVGGDRYVAVTGELDVATCPQLAAVLDRERGGGPGDITIDLAAVTFCDSTALNLLAATHTDLAAEGDRLVVVNPSPVVVRVFAIAGLSAWFTYAPSE